MPHAEIIKAEPILLGISLERPFPLGFGSLQHLPRVLYHLTAIEGDQKISGIGEASIDFPFSTYDAWDIYWALTQIDLIGRSLEEREKILTDRGIRGKTLESFPAAFTALNMAVDDLTGHWQEKPVVDLYGQRRNSGRALASISFQDNTAFLIEEIEGKIKQGFIPKPKVGQGIEKDLNVITAVAKLSQEKGFPFVLDFNAQYQPEEFESLVTWLKRNRVCLDRLIFLEQPTLEKAGIQGLVFARQTLENAGYLIPIMADESFVRVEDALLCCQEGIALNFKLHKVGGIWRAREIEKAMTQQAGNLPRAMVGGTFPTAIGRTYDQQGAAVLETTELPGDGWEPATDWFKGEKHLIKEEFGFDKKKGEFVPMSGPGLGIEPKWDNIAKHRIDNPKEEYRLIRTDRQGRRLNIELKPGKTYSLVYRERTGRDPDWNL